MVLVNKPTDVRWGGVFSSFNTRPKATARNSNEALVVFVSPGKLDDPLIGTLAHEVTHLVQFYQTQVVRDVTRQSWFNETTAMMAEDILAPKLIGKTYAPSLAGRINTYLVSGGGLSLTDWGNLEGSSYSMGMTFGAFLNRRYGTKLFRDFIGGCEKNDRTSWDCADRLIRKHGGTGVADEFSRMGASVFSAMPAPTAASGYGFPALTTGEYTLGAIDLSKYRSDLRPRDLQSAIALSATAQTYSITTIQPGQSSFSAPNLVIPPRTVLTVISPPLGQP